MSGTLVKTSSNELMEHFSMNKFNLSIAELSDNDSDLHNAKEIYGCMAVVNDMSADVQLRIEKKLELDARKEIAVKHNQTIALKVFETENEKGSTFRGIRPGSVN